MTGNLQNHRWKRNQQEVHDSAFTIQDLSRGRTRRKANKYFKSFKISNWIPKLLFHHPFLEVIPSNAQSRDPSPSKDCIAFSRRLSPFHVNLSLASAGGLVFSKEILRAQHRP